MAKSIAIALLHQGLVRRHNEDNLYMLTACVPSSKVANFEHSAASSDPLQLYAVADGMGGGGIGDVASRTVLQVLDQQRRLRVGPRFEFTPFARDLIDLANRSVCEQLSAYEALPIGTTLSLLAIDRDNAYTLSLGNSRIYLYRDSELHCLTEDHISQLPDRRRLTRYLGFQADGGLLEVENMTRTVLCRGDILLLTTDGITDVLTDEQIAAELAAPVAFVQQIRRLRDLALEKGGRDNLALIGVRIQVPVLAEQPERVKRITGRHAVMAAIPGSGRLPAEPETSSADLAGQPYAGPAIRGGAGYLPENRQRRLIRPILFFLVFVLLGILLGKVLFSLPAWLKILFG